MFTKQSDAICVIAPQAFHFHLFVISVKQLCVSRCLVFSVLKGIVNATAHADSSCLRMALSLRAQRRSPSVL